MPEEEFTEIFTDGASRGNPGPSCYAFLFVRDGRVIAEKSGFLGEMTNNAAEYHAVLHALRNALDQGYQRVHLHSDSELVVRQITGTYRAVHPVLAALCKEVRHLSMQFKTTAFDHVPRTDRFIAHADALCNGCLDTRGGTRMQSSSYTIRPIGVIHSPYPSREQAPRQGTFSAAESELEIFSPYTPGLRDIGATRHLIVLYWAHTASRTVLEARPPHSRESHGVFATRAPDRPNPVSLCVVRLIGISGSRIRVLGLDAIDGSPLVDIKPFSPEIDCPEQEEQITR
jgi:tRNA-Thr(GGU) m(6)t(6)A37 methyltransferase TsaA